MLVPQSAKCVSAAVNNNNIKFIKYNYIEMLKALCKN